MLQKNTLDSNNSLSPFAAKFSVLYRVIDVSHHIFGSVASFELNFCDVQFMMNLGEAS